MNPADDDLIPAPDLEGALTSRAALDRIVAALQAHAFVLAPEDVGVLDAARGLTPIDGDDYQRGFDLLEELAALQTRIDAHHDRFRVPLRTLTGTVHAMVRAAEGDLAAVKQDLARRLGAWQRAETERQRAAAVEAQRIADAAARVAQQSKATALQAIADAQADPALRTLLHTEAAAVAAAPALAAPIPPTPTPTIAGGYTRTTWRCEVRDLRALLTAWLAGTVTLPDAVLLDGGLQSFLNTQATQYGAALGQAYPGCAGVPVPTAVTRKRTGVARR